jgi:predicted DNA-binding transcriptional regulator AlpA
MPRCSDLAAVLAFLSDHGIVISKKSIYNWMHAGILPRPFHMGSRAFWSLDDVAAAIVRLKNGGD